MLPPYVLNDNVKPGQDLIHYSGPYWSEIEVNAAVNALTKGQWLSSGSEVMRFEKLFSKEFNHKASIMVNSGSSANLVMLAALKKYFYWPDQSEIIVSVVGFPTTYTTIVQNNLKPVFIDIELETLNFDLNLIEEKITDKTKAIFISPVLGNPPDILKLQSLADRHGLRLILDGCDSLGSKYLNKPLSDFAVATSCSFYPAHHLTTGEGGMVSSQNEELIKLVRRFAWWGRDCYCVGQANFLKNGTCAKRFDYHLGRDEGIVDHKYIFTELGYNLKPLDLQGAIGIAQLSKFPIIHKQRRAIKDRLTTFINNLNQDFKVLNELKDAETSWFGVPIIAPEETKQKLVTHLENKKIQTRNYFAGNILKHPGFKHLSDASRYPNANQVLKQIFFIGCYPGYSEEVLTYIEDTFKTFKRDTPQITL